MLTACHRQKRATVTTSNNTTIIDRLPAGYKLLAYDAQRRKSRYHVYYIGKITDTIELSMPVLSRYDHSIDYDTVNPFTSNINHLKIFVDTSISTAHCIYHYYIEDNIERPEGKHMYLAYPVFVYNPTDSFIHIGIFNLLNNMVRQAKNTDGQWQNIESKPVFGCGTGARDIVAGPHQMIVAKALRYKGDYYTACRLKLTQRDQEIYSNTFYDYIDKRQLADTLKPY